MARFYRGNSAPRQVRGFRSNRETVTPEESLASMEKTLVYWVEQYGEDFPPVKEWREKIAQMREVKV